MPPLKSFYLHLFRTNYLLSAILLLCLFLTVETKAQQVISTGGAHFTSPTAQISFTIGEPVIQTLLGTNQILTQGFHQTQLIITRINEVQMLTKIEVYPNPTKEKVFIKTQSSLLNNATCLLYNSHGELIKNQLLSNQITEFGLPHNVPGEYFLKIVDKTGVIIQSFKIIITQ